MTYKTLWKGFFGSLLFGLIAALVWIGFSFFGQLGFWSAPAFGILIPLGFKLFSKERPVTKRSFVIMAIVLVLTVLLSAYIGYVINVYAMFIEYGYSIDAIHLSDVRNYIIDLFINNPAHFRLDVIIEIGVGIVASAAIGALVINKYKRSLKEEHNER